MRKVKIEWATELKVRGILGFMKRKVTKFGSGAKVNCPKEYLGRTVYLVICEDNGEVGRC
jgi:putative transposon-encoded protein